jgi:TonB family protein
MKPAPYRWGLVTVALFLFTAIAQTYGQATTGPDEQPTGVVITRLSPPRYPPLAHQARIEGEVRVTVLVQQDGSVKSVVADGHPLLAPTASESALKSQFECRQCGEEVTPYAMVFTFRIAGEETEHSSDNGEVTQLGNHVTVTVRPVQPIEDWEVMRRPVRSPKCLYLWKCGRR